jgi:thioredoxin 1
MEPIIEELKEEYKDKIDIQTIDVYENRSETEKYEIKLIPTQIFLIIKEPRVQT